MKNFGVYQIENFQNFSKMVLFFTLAQSSGPQWPFSTNHTFFRDTLYNKLQYYLVGFFQIGLVIIMKTKLAASTPGCCNMKLIIWVAACLSIKSSTIQGIIVILVICCILEVSCIMYICDIFKVYHLIWVMEKLMGQLFSLYLEI